MAINSAYKLVEKPQDLEKPRIQCPCISRIKSPISRSARIAEGAAIHVHFDEVLMWRGPDHLLLQTRGATCVKRMEDSICLHTDLVYSVPILPIDITEDYNIPTFPNYPASHNEGKALISFHILVYPVIRSQRIEVPRSV